MKTSMTHDAAMVLVKKNISKKQTLFHSLESGAVMKKLAEHLKAKDKANGCEEEINVELWANTGLLHDLDSDRIGNDLSRHGKETVNILKSEGYDIPEMNSAIISHTEALGINGAKRQTRLEYALAASENLCGLISAYVAIRSSKTIAGLKVKSITKKLKDRSFSAAVNRQFISDVTPQLGIERGDFIKIAIEAMTEISDITGM